jgi:hypothetical protein
MQDLRNNKTMPAFLENDDFFAFYPQQFPEFLEKIIWFGEGPKNKIGKTLWQSIRSSGALSFKRLKDIYRIKNL